MENSPARNSGAPDTLFDLAEATVAPVSPCKGPGCGKPVEQSEGRGRPKDYCSMACRSRANRARTAARTAAAIAAAPADSALAVPEPAKPQPAAQAAPLDQWQLALPEEQRPLMRTAVLVDTRTRLFLQHVADEPSGSLAVYLEAVDDLAERLRKQARAITAAAVREMKSGRPDKKARPAKPAGASISDRPQNVAADPAGSRLRGLVDERLAQQSAGPGGTPVPASGEGTVAVPRDPLLRGLPRGMDVRVPLDERTFGYDWVLAGWTVQPDVLVVLGEGHQVGWVERGLDGGDGWVAVHEGFFLGDPVTLQAVLHETPELAARTIHHAHVHDL